MKLFIPPAQAVAPVIRESRLIRDYTMPERDWSAYEAPIASSLCPDGRAFLAPRFRQPKDVELLPAEQIFIVRQAS